MRGGPSLMDTTIASGETTSGTAVTETVEQPTTTGSAAPETKQEEGGGSQESTESGQAQEGGRRKWSMGDEVRELRAQRRELREQLASFGTVQEELRALREEMNRQRQPGTAKTPANFWQDPEGTIESKLDERLERLQNNMLERFQTTREQEYAQQALRQEQASAAEFIRTQKGYDPSDDEDLIEIIEAIPKRTRENSDPFTIAEFAWNKLQVTRGIGDRTALKQRAASVQGQPPGAGFGQKNWSRAEFDAACDMLEKKPHDPKNTELLKELESAWKDGRVKN